MKNSIYRISLDIQKNSSQVSLSAKKGDTARSIHITFTENGKPYKIEDGCYAVFTATKPDGNELFNDCIIKDNVIVYDFTEQTVSAVGQMHCEVTVYDLNGDKITSSFLDIVVHDVECNANDIVSSDEFTALISATEDARNIAADLEKKRDEGYFKGEPGETPSLDGVIQIWQPNTEYKVGDVVIANLEEVLVFEDNLYFPEPSRTIIAKCIGPHKSTTPFSLVNNTFGENVWEILQETKAYYDALGRGIHNTYATKDEVGNIETALDNIIAIQNQLIGGDT